LDGDNWRFESFKTKKMIVVPLIGYCRPAYDILQKYDFKLPAISPQKFNEYLKEAAKLAGLDRLVSIRRYVGKREIVIEKPLHEFMSAHMGRRTAVSLLLNVEHMPLHLVREITGHGDLRTLDLYLNKDESALVASVRETQGINKPIMKVVKTNAG
jgi:integrase